MWRLRFGTFIILRCQWGLMRRGTEPLSMDFYLKRIALLSNVYEKWRIWFTQKSLKTSVYGLLGRDALYYYKWNSSFWGSMLNPSSGLKNCWGYDQILYAGVMEDGKLRSTAAHINWLDPHHTQLYFEDGGSELFRNVGIFIQDWMVSQTVRPQSAHISPWKYENFYCFKNIFTDV
jgi:hypothetical protein